MRDIAGCYRMLWGVMWCYGMLWGVMGCYGMLWGIMGCWVLHREGQGQRLGYNMVRSVKVTAHQW